MDIDGAAALVTGGASGLGEATARRLAAAGARVAVLDMNLDAAEAVAAEIGGLAAACDVSSAEGAEAALAAATQAHGPARI
ncbi:MAG: SDR family NAD(P)-dependent oxidoreductase, partial [Alphaproteobacteria bacterium]|nr:SDR family NAD(P)-dependent oxidoreductase [Alphaproteobacteria bacterium]